MKRAISVLGLALLATAVLAATAQAAQFGLKGVDVTFSEAGGAPEMQAGSHPFAFVTKLAVNEEEDPVLGKIPAGQVRDLTIELPPGL